VINPNARRDVKLDPGLDSLTPNGAASRSNAWWSRGAIRLPRAARFAARNTILDVPRVVRPVEAGRRWFHARFDNRINLSIAACRFGGLAHGSHGSCSEDDQTR
jgi:hypothetical protein